MPALRSEDALDDGVPLSLESTRTTHAPYATILCVRTTLDIDAELMEEAVRLSGKRTKAVAVEAALNEYVRPRRKELLLGLGCRGESGWRIGGS